MAEEINQLLTIEIDQRAVNNAIAKATEAKQAIDNLRQANKELSKAEGDNTEQIIKNNIEIKKNSAIIRDNERIVLANEQAQESNTGSIEQLRRQLSVVTVQWKNLSEGQRENTEEGKRLTKQKLDLTNKLKGLEKATGDTRRNVGNYTDSIREAISGSSAFGQSLVGATDGLKATTRASLKFLATPLGAVLGAIALAVGGVVSAFQLFRTSLERTEKGQTAINRIMSVFRGIANGVLKVVEPLAEVLADGLAIGFDLITDAVLSANTAIAKALEFLGLDDWAQGLRNANVEIINMVESSKQLADAETELNKIRREQDKLQLDSQRRAEELRQIRDDESKSIQERIEANRELASVLEQQQEAELTLAQRTLEIAQLRAQVEGKSTTNLDAIAEAELKISEIEERITSQRSEQLINENSLRKEAEELRLEANEKRFDDLKETLQKQKELELEYQEFTRDIVNDEVVKLKEKFAQGLIDKQEYEEALIGIEAGALEIRRLNAELAKENALDDLTLTEEQRIEIINEAEKEILAIREASADAAIKSRQRELKAQIQSAKQEEKTEKALAHSKESLQEGVFDLVIDGLGRESLASKAFASIQAGINTAQAITNTLANVPAPANIPAAALVGIQGLLQQKKIISTETPDFGSFAKGGFTGNGFGVADSSGFKPAGLVHEGEYVVKKSMVDNPAFSSIISTLENARIKGYADGGFVGRNVLQTTSSDLSGIENAIQLIANRPSIVKVSDINRVSNEVNQVRVSGLLN